MRKIVTAIRNRQQWASSDSAVTYCETLAPETVP